MKKTTALILITAGLAFAACSPSTSNRNQVLPDGDYQTENGLLKPLRNEEGLKIEAILLEAQRILALEQNKEIENVERALLMQKVIQPLSQYAINFEFLSDVRNRSLGGDSFRYVIPPVIETFNEALVLAHSVDPNWMETKTTYMQSYKAIMFWDCEGGESRLEGSCEFLNYYAGVDSTYTTRIIKIFHDMASDDKEKERMILAAYDAKNNRLDTSLRFMLLERISRSVTLQNKSSLSDEQIQRDVDLFANILKLDFKNFVDNPDYTKLIEELNPWQLSRNVSDPRSSSQTQMIRLAAIHLIYDKENGGLHPSLLEAINGSDSKNIDGIRMRLGHNYEQGLDFQLGNIVGTWDEVKDEYETYLDCTKNQQNDPELICRHSIRSADLDLAQEVYKYTGIEFFIKEGAPMKDFLLKKPNYDTPKDKTDTVPMQIKFDEYMFLVYQLNYGHFSQNDAEEFWAKTGKDQTRIIEAIENMIMLQVVSTIGYTNTLMNQFYEDNPQTGIIELLRESRDQATVIAKAWKKAIARTYKLWNFLGDIYIQQNPQNHERFERLAFTTEAIEKNIKYLVTYPNMFPLLHIMASKDLNGQVIIWGRPFTFSNDTIIKLFFKGHFPPWWEFARDSDPLDTTQIIYAYYYTLVTQIFETYKNNSYIKFSVTDFFEAVVKQILSVGEKEMISENERLTKKLNDFQANYDSMLAACREERTKGPAELEAIANEKARLGGDFKYSEHYNPNLLDRVSVTNEISYIDLDKQIYRFTDTSTNMLGDAISKLYADGSDIVIKKLRTRDFDSFKAEGSPYTLDYANVLLDIYKYIVGPNSQRAIDVQRKFDETYQNYEENRVRYINTYLKVLDETNDCVQLFASRSRTLRHAIVFAEVKELDRTFELMYDAYGSQIIDGSLALNGVEESDLESTRQKIASFYVDDNFFPRRYRDEHSWLKLRANSVTYYPMEIHAKIRRHMLSTFPDQYDIEEVNFEDESIYEKKKPRTININWKGGTKEQIKEAFISAGLSEFGKVASWSKSYPSLVSVVNRLDLLTEFFKLNTFNTVPGVNCEKLEEERKTTTQLFKDSCREVPASRIIAEFKDLIEFMHINDEDAYVMDLVGTESKYDTLAYERYVKFAGQKKLYSPLDLLFKKILSDQEVNKVDSVWFQDLLDKFVKSLAEIEASTFVFPYDPEVTRIFQKTYGRWIRHHYRSIERFLEEVKKQKADGYESFQYRYRTVGVSPIDFGKPTSGFYSPLLSGHMLEKFDSVAGDIETSAGLTFSDLIREQNEKIDNIEDDQAKSTPSGVR